VTLTLGSPKATLFISSRAHRPPIAAQNCGTPFLRVSTRICREIAGIAFSTTGRPRLEPNPPFARPPLRNTTRIRYPAPEPIWHGSPGPLSHGARAIR
jgi:hypothetical protein